MSLVSHHPPPVPAILLLPLVDVTDCTAHTIKGRPGYGRWPRRGIKSDYGRPYQFLLSNFLINNF